jgi:hypothetical protein
MNRPGRIGLNKKYYALGLVGLDLKKIKEQAWWEGLFCKFKF